MAAIKTYGFHVTAALAVLFFALLHISGSARIPLLDEIEEYLYDVRLRWNMPGTLDDRIVIVDIDERSIAAEGHFPWQRDKMATLVNNLFDIYGVRVLAFDMAFPEREESTALRLIEELRASEPALPFDQLEQRWQTDQLFAESVVARDVILGFAFKQFVPEREQAEAGLLPLPSLFAEQLDGINLPFYTAAGFVGNFDALQEASEFGAFFSYPRLDDVTRITPLLQAYQGDVFEALGMAAARLYLGNPPLQFAFASDTERNGLTLEQVVIGDIGIPTDEKLQVYIPFRGRQGSFAYVSATDVINQEATLERLQDKLVFVGTSAAGLLDLRATPVADAYVGVEIHANLASGILDQRFMRSPPYVAGIEAVFIAVNLVLLAALIPLLSPVAASVFILTVVFANVALNFYLWTAQQLILPLSSVLAAIFTLAFIQIIYDYFVESRRKQRLGRLFGQYIPAELVEEIDASGEELSLEGENRDMSVLFSDVRGFTTISESLEPSELTQLMNEFLTPITRIIHDNRGTIDKYMGDAVMAFWGAPLRDESHAQNALDAALAMVEAMQQVTQDFAAKNWPEIKVGIGISSGPMNVGNMGSEFRMAYTVMGDVVNLGSRLEGQTKNYGADIIISQETADQVSGICLRELDLIRVKGKNVPITIYEPLCRDADADEALREELQEYQQALAHYRKADFQQAQALFLRLAERHPQPLYALYLERIQAFLDSPPPPDWDGVFVATSK
ncbi:MAG: adenylate/guanylate cyclase domain-containing protein [Pseudomonadota bacterium]